ILHMARLRIVTTLFAPSRRFERVDRRSFVPGRLRQAAFLHFAMKLFLAAPCSGLPSLLTALLSQASLLPLFMKLVLAAPWSAFPSLPIAWLSQDCAIAVPAAKEAINAARIMRFIISSFLVRSQFNNASGRKQMQVIQ